MARWFDDAAKRAADGAGEDLAPAAGFSRRTALKRGAVVAGVAWTAPMLMQTRAYAGVSACGPGTFVCHGILGYSQTVACCSSGTTAKPDSAGICYTYASGQPYCAQPTAPGGYCGNQGNGICTLSKCNGDANQCNGCAVPHICGGESSYCLNAAQCGEGLTCTTTGTTSNLSHCRRLCTGNSGCSSSQVCDSTGFCAQLCLGTVTGVTTSNCQSNETCSPDGTRSYSICSYSQSA